MLTGDKVRSATGQHTRPRSRSGVVWCGVVCCAVLCCGPCSHTARRRYLSLIFSSFGPRHTPGRVLMTTRPHGHASRLLVLPRFFLATQSLVEWGRAIRNSSMAGWVALLLCLERSELRCQCRPICCCCWRSRPGVEDNARHMCGVGAACVRRGTLIIRLSVRILYTQRWISLGGLSGTAPSASENGASKKT